MLTKVLPPFGIIRITTSNAEQQNVGGVGLTVPCTGATTLAAGANSDSNYGGGRNLYVGTSITAVHDSTSVAIMQFDISNFMNAAGNVNNAILELTVSQVTSSSEASVLTVVGLNPCTAVSWDENALTWDTAGFVLNTPTTVISRILNNFVQLDGIDPGNDMCGHITVQAADAGTVKRVDVTQYVQMAAQGGATSVGFLVARRFRSNGVCVGACPNTCVRGVCNIGTNSGNAAGPYPADDLDFGASVAFFSDASASPPVLRLMTDVTYPAGDSYDPPSLMCTTPPPPAPLAPNPSPPAPPAVRTLPGAMCFSPALLTRHALPVAADTAAGHAAGAAAAAGACARHDARIL